MHSAILLYLPCKLNLYVFKQKQLVYIEKSSHLGKLLFAAEFSEDSETNTSVGRKRTTEYEVTVFENEKHIIL